MHPSYALPYIVRSKSVVKPWVYHLQTGCRKPFINAPSTPFPALRQWSENALAVCRHFHSVSRCLLRVGQVLSSHKILPIWPSAALKLLDDLAYHLAVLHLQPSALLPIQTSSEHAFLYGKCCKGCGWFMAWNCENTQLLGSCGKSPLFG